MKIKLRHPPYLIQLFRIRNPEENSTGKPLSHTVAAEYMGSAEFEFGVIPKAYREIRANFDSFQLSSVSLHESDPTLFVWHDLNEEGFQQYVEYLKEFRGITKPEHRTKTLEGVRFEHDLLSKWCYSEDYKPNDFWWDIRNQVMWSFKETFMLQLRERLESSFAIMNDRDTWNKGDTT